MIEDFSIEQLERNVWPPENDYASTLIRRCHEYRRIPVGQLDAEQIRLLIGQQIGVPYLLPRAMAILAEDILAEGDFYPGDLLSAVIHLPDEAWTGQTEAREALMKLLQNRKAVWENADLSHDLLRRIHSYVSS